jgi:hypothetical protein
LGSQVSIRDQVGWSFGSCFESASQREQLLSACPRCRLAGLEPFVDSQFVHVVFANGVLRILVSSMNVPSNFLHPKSFDNIH